MDDKVKELRDIISNIKNQIEGLDKSTPILKPDANAGNLLVDPVIVAALTYYWEKLIELFPDLALIEKCERCAGNGVFHSSGYEYGEDKPISCSQCHGTGIIPIPLAEALKEIR